MTTPTLTVLSMGWGKQTWTMAAMMALDEMPRADYIVFADTAHEHQATYEFIRQWTPWLGEHGLNVATVQAKRTDVAREDWSASVMIPAYTLDAKSSQGQIRRLCTHDWKITPIRHFIREKMTERGLKPTPGVAESWMGISLDEFQRMRTSDVAYITNVYPLVDRRMTRAACIAWLREHDLPEPPKSACVFCPYKSRVAWQRTKREGGPDWQDAVAVDNSIRDRRKLNAGKPGHEIQKGIALYVHPRRKPLPEAVTIPEDFGASQPMLEGFDDVCDGGYCGV